MATSEFLVVKGLHVFFWLIPKVWWKKIHRTSSPRRPRRLHIWCLPSLVLCKDRWGELPTEWLGLKIVLCTKQIEVGEIRT